MEDKYRHLGINNFLVSKSSLANSGEFVPGVDFANRNDRGAVTKYFLGTGIVSFSEISAGTVGVTANVGGANLRLEGGNGRIVVNDGTVDRIYLGSL